MKRAAPLLAAALAAGCGIGPTPCDRTLGSNPYVLYTQGFVQQGVYMTSTWDGYDEGPGGTIPDGGLPALPDAGCGDFAGQGGGAPQPGDIANPRPGGLLFFPGGMHYKLAHGLGAVPRNIQEFLSFDQYGTRTCGSTVAIASGNQVEIDRVDDRYIYLENGSCSEYWLLVTASAGAALPAPPAGP